VEVGDNGRKEGGRMKVKRKGSREVGWVLGKRVGRKNGE
jgi:hypothetical protein